ncbi:MAG: TIM barrel protein [Clostridia bacterium]|nr:TIM barrel protein [Clostridia bacterium]
MDEIKFGPSGNDELFYTEGFSSSLDAPAWLKEKGLSAYEYSFGRGYRMTSETAQKLGQKAKENGITLSIHAPYYINFANPDDEMAEKSFGYILTGLKLLKAMGGKHLVFHIGSENKQERKTALDLIDKRLDVLIKRVYESGYLENGMMLCPETMGKSAQIGTWKEIIDFCKKDKILVPTFDFGHIYALNVGNFGSFSDFLEVLSYGVKVLGYDRMKNCHIHFSKIMYSEKGEVKHLNYTDEGWGPNFLYLAQALKELKLTPTIICESAGNMATDSVIFKELYENA